MTHTNYEISIVRFGTRSTVKSDVYLNYHIYNQPDSAVDMDYFFWILKSEDRTIVVDTGFSRQGGAARDRTFLLDPMVAFRAAGVSPHDAPDIIVTHAHYDHIGNLSEFDSSRIYIAEEELEFWLGPFAERKQFKHSIEVSEIEALRKADTEGRVERLQRYSEIAPGIKGYTVGGHTPGQLVLTIETSEGQVVLASDAIHYYEEYESDLPFMFVNNLQEMYAGFDCVRKLMNTTGKFLLTGHDPETFNKFPPLETGPLAGHIAKIGEK